MVAQRKALRLLWHDRCDIIRRQAVTDKATNLTDFKEVTIAQNQPCKLSFESSATADGTPVAAITQSVKLFLAPDLIIPAGCKISVRRTVAGKERTFEYANSGEPEIYSEHQEILLKAFEGWA